ncbi:hypothetical protein [Buchananella felis]|uniref:hypothetical protein n=1 Tax=Buchananella felis TaxID=3231492 RepID=UPI003527AC44
MAEKEASSPVGGAIRAVAGTVRIVSAVTFVPELILLAALATPFFAVRLGIFGAVLAVVAAVLVAVRRMRLPGGDVMAAAIYLPHWALRIVTSARVVDYAAATALIAAVAGMYVRALFPRLPEVLISLVILAAVSLLQLLTPRGMVRRASIAAVVVGFVTSVVLLSLGVLQAYMAGRVDVAVRAGLLEPGDNEPLFERLARVAFGNSLPVWIIIALAVAVLVSAGVATLEGLPVFMRRLGRESLVPRQLRRAGNRLAEVFGVLAASGGAAILLVAARADVGTMVAVFLLSWSVSFCLGKWALVRFASHTLSVSGVVRERRRAKFTRLVAGVAAVLSGVLAVASVAWSPLIALAVVAVIALLWVAQGMVARSYQLTDAELKQASAAPARGIPPRTHAFVLLTDLTLATHRAIAYARAARPHTLQALCVLTGGFDGAQLRRRWEAQQLPVDLTFVDAPDGELARAVQKHVDVVRAGNPNDLVMVYVPELLPRTRLEAPLYNYTTGKLQRALAGQEVVIATVPWQLGADAAAPTSGAEQAAASAAPGPDATSKGESK